MNGNEANLVKKHNPVYLLWEKIEGGWALIMDLNSTLVLTILSAAFNGIQLEQI